jgi:hypothetical protein
MTTFFLFAELPPQPEPIKNINELIKTQLRSYAFVAEALSAVQGEIEELSVAAEGNYRKSRDH